MHAFALTEDQAITAITVGMDFGVDQASFSLHPSTVACVLFALLIRVALPLLSHVKYLKGGTICRISLTLVRLPYHHSI